MFASVRCVSEQPITDGRRLRRDRNRVAVVQALLSLFDRGNYDPSTEVIAATADPPVSSRSLFRYFDDVDDLYRAAVDEQQRRVMPIVQRDLQAGADLPTRARALAHQRRDLWTATRPAAIAARSKAPFVQVIADNLDLGRRFLRQQVAQLFAAELAAMQHDHAVRTLAAADVLLAFESWALLTGEQGLTPDAAEETLVDTLLTLMGPARRQES